MDAIRRNDLLAGFPPETPEEMEFWISNFQPGSLEDGEEGRWDWSGAVVPIHRLILEERHDLLEFVFKSTEFYSVAHGLVAAGLVGESRRLYFEYNNVPFQSKYKATSVEEWVSLEDVFENAPLHELVNMVVYCSWDMDREGDIAEEIYASRRTDLLEVLQEIAEIARSNPSAGSEPSWERPVMLENGDIVPENIPASAAEMLELNFTEYMTTGRPIEERCDIYLFTLDWEDWMGEPREERLQNLIMGGEWSSVPRDSFLELIPEDYPGRARILGSLEE